MNAEQYLERIENKRLNGTPLYSRKEMIDFAEKYVKQLILSGVGVTLPSYDETNAEIIDGLGLIKTLKDSPFKNATTDEAYKTGFANCYNWLSEKLGN